MGHSRLSPSAAVRWMACPASVLRSEGLQDTNNTYAIEGTFAHALASFCLNTGAHPAEYVGKHARDFLTADEMYGYRTNDYGDELWAYEYFDALTVDAEMAGYIADYCDYVNMLSAREEGSITLIEQRVDLTDLLGEKVGGTADVIVVLPIAREMHTVDLKYGKGKLVTAQDNPQLALYTVGARSVMVDLFGIDIDHYVSTIYQPRKNNITSATYDFDQLYAFMEMAALKAFDTRSPNPLAHPGDEQCRYCLAKGSCPEHARMVFEVVGATEPVVDMDFEQLVEIAPSPPELLTSEDLARILPKLDTIRAWCDAVLSTAVKEAEFGFPPPGYKLVAGKMGARHWTDEAVVEDVIRNSMRIPVPIAYKSTLISPTQAEKALKPKQYNRLKEFIQQTRGKPALVPESDKRPPLELGVADSEFQTN